VRIKWQDDAILDLKELRRYIAQENPTAAAQVAARIRQATELLKDHPHSGCTGRVTDTRELVVPGLPYLLAYRSRNETIDILRVLHTSRMWPEGF